MFSNHAHISTLCKYFIWLFLRKLSHCNVYTWDNPENLITFWWLKANIDSHIPLCFISSLSWFFLPWLPWRQRIEFYKTEREIFISTGSNRKVSERSIVLSLFLLFSNFALVTWSTKGTICLYVYGSYYNNSMS